MTRTIKVMLGVCVLTWLGAAVSMAQYPSELVGFNDPPINDPAEGQEMFQIPQHSGSTRDYILLNVDPYDNNAAFRATGMQTEGEQAMEIFFRWINPADPDAWLRATTFNGKIRPNPTLDTRGKIRFDIHNRSEWIRGDVGLCIGIRETGVENVPQMGDGGSEGDIEWVGVDTTVNAVTAGADGLVDTVAAGDDVQEYAVGFDVAGAGLDPYIAVISPGTNGVIDTTPAGDDETRAGFKIAANGGRVPAPALILPTENNPQEFEIDLSTGVITHKWDHDNNPGTPYATFTYNTGVAGMTGNGVLDAANYRGVFEHIAFVNVTDDTAALIDVGIDKLQFEATVPDPTPAPNIIGPVIESDTQVQIECIDDATWAFLFVNDIPRSSGAPVGGIATMSGLTLQIGDVLTATQTANGLVSPLSAPVVVYADGTALAENFDSYMDQEELESVWSQSDPTDTRTPSLTTGGASSCQHYVAIDYPSAPSASVSRLYYNLGSVNGTNEEPLRVTYRFKHSTSNPNARSRFELTSALTREYGALGFAFTNAAGLDGQFFEQYTTMTNSPEPVIDGYYSDYFAYDYALTGIDREEGVWHTMQIEVLSDVVNFYIDDALANPRDPNSGDPIWPAGVPRVNNNNFHYVVIGNNNSTGGPVLMYDDISVTVGDTPYPFADPNPVDPPMIVGELYPLDTLVELEGVEPTATEVAVYADGAIVGNATGPFGDGTASVTVTALSDDDEVTATQTVDAVESCYSAPVFVYVPAPIVSGPLDLGAVVVTVYGVLPNAEAVTVHVDENEYSVDPMGAVEVDVAVPALDAGQLVKATQTIGGVVSDYSNTLLVANYVSVNEFNYDDISGDLYTFIELYNRSDQPINIGDYVIQIGDYIAGQDPPGVYYQVFIDPGTTIAAYGFWTVGMTDAAALPDAVVDLIDDELRLDDGQNYIALRNPNGVLLDAVAWEMNKSNTLIPEEIYTQIGVGIWGNNKNGIDPLNAQARWLDGLDTDENGRDWGNQLATPGYSNNLTDHMPYFEDCESLNQLDPIPDWSFSYKPMIAVDPTVADAYNPTAIPASPDGGLAMVSWDETGGGNGTFMAQLAKEDFLLETYIYVAPEFTADGYEETKIGVRGTGDGVHNFDWYNGATGLCWLLQRGGDWQTLLLLDENDGNDGEPGDSVCADILGQIDIDVDPALTGWQRLLLEVKGDQVTGIFGGTYGSRADGIKISTTHNTYGPGGVYVTYRESDTAGGGRPATLDAFSLIEPPEGIDGDLDGDGDVDLSDLATLLAVYGECTGDPGYLPLADINSDGCINLSDLAALLGHYGEGT